MNLLATGLFAWVLLLSACAGAVALAGDRPAAESKPLGEIAESLEKSGYVVVEAEMESGRWEVDVQKGDESFELHIDAQTGETISKQQDDTKPVAIGQAIRLTKLLNDVSELGYTSIVSAELKRGRWEVEAYKDQAKRELKIDARNGNILSDRADD